MRIAILGAGGVGGFFGGLLARAGENVTFIARGAHLEAIRARGLEVDSPVVGNFIVSAPVTDDPRTIGTVDLVVVGVKTYDLEAAVNQARPLIGPHTAVLPVQNGIDATERISAVLGSHPVLTGVAYVLSSIGAPGIIKHVAQRRIVLGEPDGGLSERVERIADVMRSSGIDCETPPDIRVPLWEKFVLLTATGGVMAVIRLPIGPIRECGEASELFRGAMAEADAVGRAMGIDLPHGLVGRHWDMVMGLPAASEGSMLQDLRAGRRLELESLNGTLIRQGQRIGISTPLNFAIYAALKPYADGAAVRVGDR